MKHPCFFIIYLEIATEYLSKEFSPSRIYVTARLLALQTQPKLIAIPIIKIVNTYSLWKISAKNGNQRETPWIWISADPTTLILLIKPNLRAWCRLKCLRGWSQKRREHFPSTKGRDSRRGYGMEQVSQQLFKLGVRKKGKFIIVSRVLSTKLFIMS